MPRAQSPPRRSRTHSRVSPLTSKPPSKRIDSLPDTLELSSSSSESSHTPPPPKTTKRVSTLTTKKPQLGSQDVIEISSDEDDEPPTQESIIADLRIQVKKLKEESSKYRVNCSTLVREVARIRDELKEASAKASKAKPTEGKIVLDPSQLEDNLSCEICTGRMYSPYLIPDCGHTFCLPCLRDWFGATHARFIQTHPHWNTNISNGYVARIQGLLRPDYLAHPDIHHRLLQMQHPQPEYTCPTCRKRALRRPVEVYALKSLVRNIVAAADDGRKGSIPPEAPVVERRQGHLVVVDPWDGFFPSER